MATYRAGWGDLPAVLGEGWRLFRRAPRPAVAYAAAFVLPGALLMTVLLLRGWTPFLIPAAGAFMLVAPIGLAGFFGIARALEQGKTPGLGSVRQGFRAAAPALWALSLVCGLLFMIFVTDAAILYAYMIGGDPVGLGALLAGAGGTGRFVFWGALSGGFIASLLFAISAFAVPVLCERRAGLVRAVVTSIRIVFGSLLPVAAWGVLLAGVTIVSVLCLPLLLLTLPWMAFASWALYRRVLPESVAVDRV